MAVIYGLKIYILINVVALSLILCLPARAQEQQSPRTRALIERLNHEVQNTLTCSENAYKLLDKVKELQDKLDAAQKSLEPKKD